MLSLCSIALCSLSCGGNIDPDQNGDLPEGVDTTINLNSGYAKKMIAMQFTSTECEDSPVLDAIIQKVQNALPGEIIPVSFHADLEEMEDPMSLSVNEDFYEEFFEELTTIEDLPKFALNFKKTSQPIANEYEKIMTEIDFHKKNYPAVCGVAIDSDYDETSRTLQVVAKFKSDVARRYWFHILLVENGIVAHQASMEDPSYTHNNVLRMMGADNLYGSRLNTEQYVEPGKEYQLKRTITISDAYKVENMKIIVTVLDTRDGGKTYCCNNANICSLGEDVDYLMIKK